MTLQPGFELGPYRILEQIGKGAMATVYKAYQPSLSRYVAVKVLPDFYAQEPTFLERFRQEAMAIAQLRHPNVLTVHDYGEERGRAYIVYEYIAGGTLKERLGDPLPPEYALSVLRPIAAALDYAHASGMLHRDVKPSNILLTPDGTPVLGDFGLAKILEKSSQLTLTGTSLGTPEYMAPEQALEGTLGPTTDVYSLGVVLYEMVVCQLPFAAETPMAVLLAHLREPLPPPRSRNPNLSEEIEAVLLQALAKEPGERFPSAGEMIQALEVAVSGRSSRPFVRPGSLAAKLREPSLVGVKTKLGPSLGRLWRLSPRARVVAAFLVLLLAALLGGGSVYLLSRGEGKGPAPASQAAPPLQPPLASPLGALPQALYRDDFADPDKILFPRGSGTTDQGLVYRRGPENGEYVVRVLRAPNGSGVFSSGPPFSADAFAVEVEARAEGKIDSLRYGTWLIYGPEDHFEILLEPTTGQYEAFVESGRLVSRLNIPFFKTGTAVNHLRPEVRGPEIRVYINGQLADTVTNDALRRRPVSPALGIWIPPLEEVRQGEEARVVFDNFNLYELEGAQAPTRRP